MYFRKYSRRSLNYRAFLTYSRTVWSTHVRVSHTAHLIINSIIQLIHIFLQTSCKLHIAIEVFVSLNHNLQILPSPLICFKIHSLEKWDFGGGSKSRLKTFAMLLVWDVLYILIYCYCDDSVNFIIMLFKKLKVDSLELWFIARNFVLIFYALQGNGPFWRGEGGGREEKPEKKSLGVIMDKKYIS